MPSQPEERQTAPKNVGLTRALIRFLLLAAVVVIGFSIVRFSPLSEYFTRESILELLNHLRNSWWAPLALVGLYMALSPIGLPATPLVFAGGAVFGLYWGGLYNFLGCFAGAAVSFLLARALGRDLVVHVIDKKHLDKVEGLLTRHGFWALVRIRFIPVPFPIVNYGAALAGVRLSTFLASSALGLLPAILIYTYFVTTIVETAAGPSPGHILKLALSVVLLLSISFLPTLFKWLQKRRRLRTLAASEADDG